MDSLTFNSVDYSELYLTYWGKCKGTFEYIQTCRKEGYTNLNYTIKGFVYDLSMIKKIAAIAMNCYGEDFFRFRPIPDAWQRIEKTYKDNSQKETIAEKRQ